LTVLKVIFIHGLFCGGFLWLLIRSVALKVQAMNVF
jgi:hypothetical protein